MLGLDLLELATSILPFADEGHSSTVERNLARSGRSSSFQHLTGSGVWSFIYRDRRAFAESAWMVQVLGPAFRRRLRPETVVAPVSLPTSLL
jgi:hypothetical protein